MFRSAALSQKAALQMQFWVTTPLRENSVWSAPQSATNAKFKIIFPLKMARAQAEAILNRPASEGVQPQTTERVLRLFYKKRCISVQKANCRLVYFVHLC